MGVHLPNMSARNDFDGGFPGRFWTSFTFWIQSEKTREPSPLATIEPYAETCAVVVLEYGSMGTKSLLFNRLF